MAFFDQKLEVIEIKLTQFGKNSLSRGVFKPEYYRFFDDDILYNIEKAGLSEHQNDTEKRILEQTPRLKTQHLNSGVETRYFLDDEQIINRERSRFEILKRNLNPDYQDKILKYPLGEQDISEENNPRFSVRVHDSSFEQSAEIDFLNVDGVIKKIPQLSIKPTYQVTFQKVEEEQNKRVTEEEHFDFLSDDILFKNGSNYKLNRQNVILDIQELSTFYGLENFEIEVFEIQDDVPIKIDDLDEIRKLFIIKTDEDVEIEGKKTQKQTNYRREEEY